ncbi:Ff.00g114960.m01.CDS01 [Fusarium sp. VM40]|nr:Ff.00g114960.m01.CDS01 [Fusarium sp. VM40]
MVPKLVSRTILVISLCSLFWWAFFRSTSHSGGNHEVTTAPLHLFDFINGASGDSQKYSVSYGSQEAYEFCASHGYSAFVPKSASGQRKVFDMLMINTELDFLEIHLNTLYEYVDYFIIVESPKSFQGNKKPLVLKENWSRFRRYHDKIVYHELVFPSTFNPHRPWDYEDLQRDAPFNQVMLGLEGEQAPYKGDVIIVADVDEIPRPQTLVTLRYCDYPRRLTLASKFYYYSYQFLHVGPEWQHPQATYYEGRRTLKPTNLRNGDGGFRPLRFLERGVLSNASWHCSSCFPTIDQFLNKMASFSHVWMNRDQYRDKNKIASAVREGKDLWGREHDKFLKIESNSDLPPLVLEEAKRFSYMISRDGPSAGFTDYKGEGNK